jgi:hypothetical protein
MISVLRYLQNNISLQRDLVVRYYDCYFMKHHFCSRKTNGPSLMDLQRGH